MGTCKSKTIQEAEVLPPEERSYSVVEFMKEINVQEKGIQEALIEAIRFCHSPDLIKSLKYEYNEMCQQNNNIKILALGLPRE